MRSLTDGLVEGDVGVDHPNLFSVVGDRHTGQQQRHHVESVLAGLTKPRACQHHVGQAWSSQMEPWTK
jgi:hypothetical protein